MYINLYYFIYVYYFKEILNNIIKLIHYLLVYFNNIPLFNLFFTTITLKRQNVTFDKENFVINKIKQTKKFLKDIHVYLRQTFLLLKTTKNLKENH